MLFESRARSVSRPGVASLVLLVVAAYATWATLPGEAVAQERALSLEAESPTRQSGSQGEDRKPAASGGEVLGREFGGEPGHFAEYEFDVEEAIEPLRISIRYARALSGHGEMRVELDGERLGDLRYDSTGGWGASRDDFEWMAVEAKELEAGKHTLRLTVLEPRSADDFPPIEMRPSPVLDRVGGRRDKNSVGHGANVALYTGLPSRFFFATHELGDIFSAVDGGTVAWFPDHVVTSPEAGGGMSSNVNLDRIVLSKSPGPLDRRPDEVARRPRVVEQRQVCVTRDDVVVAKILLANPGEEKVSHRVEITGDCRESRPWRGSTGGDKQSRKVGDYMVLTDANVFPALTGGLAMAVGGKSPATGLTTRAAGTYLMYYDVELAPGAEEEILVACAIHPQVEAALANLKRVLELDDPIAANRADWERFYEEDVPRFRCSDAGLEELYAFRWFLLEFSTTGGGLGFFRYPVVLEGRQAYQTFCCFSAPFMAFDLRWARDSMVGFGHVASLALAAFEDGRFPWYIAPDTPRVPIHHRSGTGLSLLPLAAWKHWLVHRNTAELRGIFAPLLRNVEWWTSDRDADGDGVYVIDHQLETGMDDLLRWPDPRLRYGAVDATSYALANIEAVREIARLLDEEEAYERLDALAAKTRGALEGALWDEESSSFRDRHPETGELSDRVYVTTFYPFFAGAGGASRMSVFAEHLLDPEEFWLPHPVPALPRSDRDFNPKGFWRGPSWPAATSHVVEAFASAAKRHDRDLLDDAGALLLRAARNHLRPRADFYERYDPLTGEPLSSFRDYMHSWWVDIIVRHVVGLGLDPDGQATIDALPLGLDHFEIDGVPLAGRSLRIEWRKPGSGDGPAGLRVEADGAMVASEPEYVPGAEPVRLDLSR